MRRSRVCYFVIDVSDLDGGTAFWAAALDAAEETVLASSRPIYRRLRLPDSEIRVLLQKTGDVKTGKERMHLDLETDDSKPKSPGSRHSAPPAWIIRPNEAGTSGSCTTRGATNSASSRPCSPACWPAGTPGTARHLAALN